MTRQSGRRPNVTSARWTASRARALSMVVAFLATALPMVAFAPGAAALGTCPTGSVSGGLNMAGLLMCFTAKGDYVGYITPGGGFSASATAAAAGELDLPGSVLTTSLATDTTAAQADGLLAADAAAADGSMLAVSGSSVAGLLAAGYASYKVTSAFIDYGCSHSWGISNWLCTESSDPTYSPNGDIGIDPAGWSPRTWPWNPVATTDGTLLTNVAPIIEPQLVSKVPYLTHVVSGSTTLGVAGDLGRTFTTSASVGQAWYAGLNAVCAANADGTGSQSYCYANLSSLRNGTGGAVPSTASAGTYTFTNVGSGVTAASSGYFLYFTFGPGTGTISGSFNAGQVITQGHDGNGGTSLTVTDRWYPVGSPLRPSFSADPGRYWETKTYCAGSLQTTADSATFHESTAMSTWPTYPASVPCTSGNVTKLTIDLVTAGGSPGPKNVFTWNAPAAITSWQAANPTCGDGHCRLGLYKILPDSSLVSCFPGGVASTVCNGWFEDATKTSDYVCTYGPLDTASDPHVTLSECNAYAPSFDPAKQGAGVKYANPSTGSSAPGVSTTTTDPVNGATATGAVSCWPSGWSAVFEPWSWVLQPIKCALSWAFVPDPATVADLKTRITTSIDTSGIGPWVTAVGGFFSLSDNSGCDGPSVTFPPTGDVLHPFSACAEPVRTAASVAHAVLTLVVVLGGGYACMGALMAGFGYRED